MIYARLIALVLKLLAALGLYGKGRLDERRADQLRDAKADLDAHERMNDVEDFSGSTDGERIKRLREFAAKHRD
jgi:hypothetical protein